MCSSYTKNQPIDQNGLRCCYYVTAILQLNSNYVGRSDTIKNYLSWILLPSLLLLLQVCSQNCTTKLKLKVHNVYMVRKLAGHPP